MIEDEDLVVAFDSIQREFISNPAKALQPWISIDDENAHVVISLINRLIDNRQTNSTDLLIRDHLAYKKFFELTEKAPWNQVFKRLEGPSRIVILDHDLALLERLWEVVAKYHRPIE